jgi:hypothetical protein
LLNVFFLFERVKNGKMCRVDLDQGQLQEWTEHSTLIFQNMKPVEISKNLFNIIVYSYLYSKSKMGVAGVIFEPHPPNFENLYNF